ncbi:terminase large subunit domain-containing protein [Paeniroseomonas aquatica]|uniref:terminase large subunit domain-containing protein n=1 Tax=Paeniroseomonas aquatica TaxID=373043 RepID=UPI003621A84E
MPDILTVMEDPNLFGPHFKGASWEPWKAFLGGLFGLPMTPEQFELFKQFTGRTVAPTAPVREASLICGRRAGKSRVCSYVATYLACFRDYRPYLAPGELATIAVLASDRRQARTIFRYIAGAFRNIPLLKPMVVEELTESITLNNSVIIEVGTANLRATRGYTYAAVVADEVAFWRDETSANPAEEILNAIRPGLSSIPNSMLLLASSPYAKKGALYSSYKRNYGRDDARTLVFKGSSLELNPSLDPDVVAEAYETDPAAASADRRQFPR